MTGTEKLEPLVIGTAMKPRLFDKKTAKELDFYFYYHNKSAWMTSLIFREWLEKVNLEMTHQDLSVLVFIDNASSHVAPVLSNVEIKFLPPNTTAKLQPLDAGIIRCFKAHYRRLHMIHVVLMADSPEVQQRKWFKIDQLTAMKWVKDAWSEVPIKTIVNCWRKCQLSVEDAADMRSYHVDVKRSIEGSIAEIADAMKTLQLDEDLAIEDILDDPAEDDVHYDCSDETVIELVLYPSEADADVNAMSDLESLDQPQELSTDQAFADAAPVINTTADGRRRRRCRFVDDKSLHW